MQLTGELLDGQAVSVERFYLTGGFRFMENLGAVQIWLLRTALSVVVAGGSAWAVSFFVADYVVTRSTAGLVLASQNLQSSMNTLSDSIKALDGSIKTDLREVRGDLREIRQDRQGFADQVANKVTELIKVQSSQDFDIKTLIGSLKRVETNLDDLQTKGVILIAPGVAGVAVGGPIGAAVGVSAGGAAGSGSAGTPGEGGTLGAAGAAAPPSRPAQPRAAPQPAPR